MSVEWYILFCCVSFHLQKHIPISSGSALNTQSHQRVVLSYEHEEFNKMAAEEVQGHLSTEVFSAYAARHAVFTCARPHPADIVEAASLAVSTLIAIYCFTCW